MKSQPTLKIRPAKHADDELAARLIYLSMRDLADYLFSEVRLSIVEIFAGLFARDDNRFSWRNTDVAEWNGVPAGILVSFTGNELTRRELAIGLGLLRLCGVWDVMRLALRAISIANSIETRRDEYYIANLAVLPDYQNLGIGSALLLHAENKARSAGLRKCSLIVNLENQAAQRLYEHNGFRIVYSKQNRGPAGEAHAGYYRMVKMLS
jgi:ribosomal protein S18 acetylase RimI-like enzyme